MKYDPVDLLIVDLFKRLIFGNCLKHYKAVDNPPFKCKKRASVYCGSIESDVSLIITAPWNPLTNDDLLQCLVFMLGSTRETIRLLKLSFPIQFSQFDGHLSISLLECIRVNYCFVGNFGAPLYSQDKKKLKVQQNNKKLIDYGTDKDGTRQMYCPVYYAIRADYHYMLNAMRAYYTAGGDETK